MTLSTEVNAQYYAWIERVERGNPIENKGNVAYTGSNLLPDNILAIIDTSAEMNGGQVCLPKNGTGRGNSPVNAKIQSIKNTGSNQGQMTGKICPALLLLLAGKGNSNIVFSRRVRK